MHSGPSSTIRCVTFLVCSCTDEIAFERCFDPVVGVMMVKSFIVCNILIYAYSVALFFVWVLFVHRFVCHTTACERFERLFVLWCWKWHQNTGTASVTVGVTTYISVVFLSRTKVRRDCLRLTNQPPKRFGVNPFSTSHPKSSALFL